MINYNVAFKFAYILNSGISIVRGLKIQMILTTQSKKMGKSVGIYPMIVIYCWNCNLDHEDQFGNTKTSICYCQLIKLQNVQWGIVFSYFQRVT